MDRAAGSGTAGTVNEVEPALAPARPLAAALQPSAGTGPALGALEDGALEDGAVEDGALMLRYRAGEARAFEILYERHKRALYRYLQRMCHRREIADDLFQEVWGKVIASRERYEMRAQFTTFLFRIAHNCLVDYFRRAGRQRVVQAVDPTEMEEELPADAHERPERQLAEVQVRAAFCRALERLPGEQRDAFILYEETGLSLEEIGRITGVGMETAKSRLRYAVAKLRAALSEHRDEHTAEMGS